MKSWKAILEKGFFRCVLVGNDLMPRFIDDYPNEFQVALPKRVSFLDPLYARQLIVDPIREPSDGSSRYRGNAVERIVELTGCSPYYIQLFCRELVQYMNRDDVRAPAIGPADVDTVARKMIAELDQTQFDNLLTPGDAEVTDIGADLVDGRPARDPTRVRADYVPRGQRQRPPGRRTGHRGPDTARGAQTAVRRPVPDTGRDLQRMAPAPMGVADDRAPVNPYANYGNPVSGSEFVGRRDRIQSIRNRTFTLLETASVSIVGPPRIGKSSLAMYVATNSRPGAASEA